VSLAVGTCAYEALTKYCNNCPFYAIGKIDEKCFKGYESQGTTCLATTYPGMSLSYTFGNCPQMDECVQRLSSCKEAHKSGSDARDCNNQEMIECFRMGDRCADAANDVCSGGKTEGEAGFDNASAGGDEPPPAPPPEQPPQYPPKPVGEAPMWDFLCDIWFILPMLAVLAFIRRE
ncbi:MAG: hypothetical protein ABII71_04995, partial [Candidatus Micrarchaeota archaeon]